MRDLGAIPGLGKPPGEGNGYPLQYSGLQDFTDCIVHVISESDRLSGFSFHFQVVLVVKTPPANAEIARDVSIPGSGRSPGGRNGNPLQYSCLENPMDRAAWGASVHGIAESDTTEHQRQRQPTDKLKTPSVWLVATVLDGLGGKHFNHHRKF